MIRKRSLFFFVLYGSFSSFLYSQGWDSDTISREPKASDKIYYRWHLEYLKRPIPPRIIQYMAKSIRTGQHTGLGKGILFTFQAKEAKRVEVALDVYNYKPIPMKKNAMGVWYAIVPFPSRFRKKTVSFLYKFRVDGIWTYDPTNSFREFDGLGSYISVFMPKQKMEEPLSAIKVQRLPAQFQKYRNGYVYEFRIYAPTARNVSIVGNFNHFNPDIDRLHNNGEGIWSIRLFLKPGEYLYRFWVDGKYVLDTNNPKTRFYSLTEERYSYLVVPKNTKR